MLKICNVQQNSLAEEFGFEIGDSITKINGFKVVDILDYLYAEAQTEFTFTVLTKDGDEVELEIEKDEDESIGLSFEDDGLKIRTCKNNCLFCFVRQMPKGMRESLYVKDDDYRQSFLCGNFVTLTNVSDEELERIIRLNLSPLYISVQAMNGELRTKMLSNPNANKIEYQLKRLSDAGIEIHAQIVLVKGLNDNKELDYSIDKLYSLSGIKTVAVVPCGITKYREGLYPIEDLTADYAKAIIEQVKNANKRNNGNLVALADEFYFKAGYDLPPFESYGEFWQVENGVGMSVKFEKSVDEILSLATNPVLSEGKYLTFTGTSAYNFISKICKKVESACKNVEIKVVEIENKFFGSTVNCTGLLVGSDVINALKEYAGKYDCLLVPNPCLMQFENIFLDDVTFEQLEKQLNMKVKRAVIDG